MKLLFSQMVRAALVCMMFSCIALADMAFGINPETTTPLKITPSRIDLGSLVFQNEKHSIAYFLLTCPAPTHLTEIDCSRAEGVTATKNIDANGKLSVSIQIDENNFCANKPYGAFIKKEVRFVTDSPDQPQFVVPITAWLDINHSARDYSQFVYDGMTRLRGFCATPNVAGAFLTSIALLFVGITGTATIRHRVQVDVAMILLSLLIVIVGLLLGMLALTYSRGAWLAFFIGCGVMGWCCRNLRQIAVVATVAFSVALIALPCGIKRFESCTSVSDDLSIANRFKLWEGALQMIGEHPIVGVGKGNFQTLFERNYQPFDYIAKTNTAVSDFLTFGVEHGPILLSLLVGTLLLLLRRSLSLAYRSESAFLATCVAVLAGMFVTSAFSTLCMVKLYDVLCGLAVLVLAWSVLKDVLRSRKLPKLLVQSLGWSLSVFLCLWTACFASLQTLPTRTCIETLDKNNPVWDAVETVAPRWGRINGIVVFLTNETDEGLVYHSTIRPLAAMGWKVIPVFDCANPAKAHELITAVHRTFSKEHLFVAGDAKGGQVAWQLLSEESSEVIKAGGGFNFLTMDLDRHEGEGTPRQPFLVYQSLYSDGLASNPAICAQRRVAFRGLPLTVVLSRDDAPHLSVGWMNFMVTLNTFFSNELHRS